MEQKPEPAELRCRCGHARGNPIVAANAKYSKLGFLSWFCGISPCPQRIEFTCPVCGYVFETVSDPDTCNKYRFRP